MSNQKKKPIVEASDAELRDFAELVLQLPGAAAAQSRTALLALISPAWPAEYIFVETAEVGEVAEEQGDSARAEAQIKLTTGASKDDPKWLIIVHATELPGGKDPVPLGNNGAVKVLQRGLKAEVPHRYIGVLRDAVRLSVAQDPVTQELLPTEVRNYPFEIIERPSRDEIEAFTERTKDLLLAA